MAAADSVARPMAVAFLLVLGLLLLAAGGVGNGSRPNASAPTHVAEPPRRQLLAGLRDVPTSNVAAFLVARDSANAVEVGLDCAGGDAAFWAEAEKLALRGFPLAPLLLRLEVCSGGGGGGLAVLGGAGLADAVFEAACKAMTTGQIPEVPGSHLSNYALVRSHRRPLFSDHIAAFPGGRQYDRGAGSSSSSLSTSRCVDAGSRVPAAARQLRARRRPDAHSPRGAAAGAACRPGARSQPCIQAGGGGQL